MFEKVNPSHPDKIADRIAGAVVDLAYDYVSNPKIAVEVLIGHGVCMIITESSVDVPAGDVGQAVARIAGKDVQVVYMPNRQDIHLSENQEGMFRCGDNGIFRGVPMTQEQYDLSRIVRDLYSKYPYDGKYIIARGEEYENLIICQSNADRKELRKLFPDAVINPLGDWTGGTDVDTGATNRKLGSDMGDAVTGGGLHGKDLSKADVSVNIYAWLKAQQYGEEVELHCAIGDENVTGNIGGFDVRIPFEETVKVARNYIRGIGGFEKFAEWGLCFPWEDGQG